MTIRSVASRCFLTLSILTALTGAASSKNLPRELQYTVDLRDTRQHLVHVTLKPVGFTSKLATFQMPVWAPGAYSVSHYGRYVVNFKARDKKGNALEIGQLNSDRWEIKNGAAVSEIAYDVLDSHSDSTSLYFAMANMDTTLFFANATALFGYYDDDKSAAASVHYEKPSNWLLVCALPTTKKGYDQTTTPTFQSLNFYAKNYDELADAPIMSSANIGTRTFREGSAVYDVAVASDPSFGNEKLDSLSGYLRKIVAAETSFFHDTPFDHYTFLVYAPTMKHMPSIAQGALEHANSSDYLLMDLNWKYFKNAFLSVFSHEFFHLWDVKRIHSSKLGPFDYTQRVKTTSLWMAEGITDYYAHTLLTRYGIAPPDAFYNDIQNWVNELRHWPAAAAKETLEELSIDESDFHMDNAQLFYIKGPLVGLLLDLEIRNRTNNQKSLDDVMFALNNDAKHGKTFTDEELIGKVSKYAGVDLTDFYTKYIRGTDSLPLENYLALMGISKAAEKGESALALNAEGRIIFQSVDSSSALGHAGVHPGDVLAAVNGTKISVDNLDMFADLRDNESSATITVERDGKPLEMPINFKQAVDPNVKRVGSLEINLHPTAAQLAIRRGVVGPNS